MACTQERTASPAWPWIQRGLLAKNDVWIMVGRVPRTLPAPGRAESVYEGTHTRIWRHPDRPGLVTKLGLLKSAPRDAFRRYWSSQARRELRATAVMQRLGFATPELLGYGVPLGPWRRWDSILFMRALPAHETLRVFLRRCDKRAARRAVLDQVAAGVAAIYAAGYHHKDCHLENVLRTEDGRLIWIDSDLRHTRKPAIQAARLASTLDQLIDTAPDFVHATEWQRFAEVIEARLADRLWTRAVAGPALAHFRTRLVSG